jgi:triosephosphate isomerase
LESPTRFAEIHTVSKLYQVIGQKTEAALKVGLSVVFCCGELLEQREGGQTDEVVQAQLHPLVGRVDWSKIVIAYEPVWAIGTGKVATPEQAQDTHASIRKWLAENVSQEVAEATRIIYGGKAES